MVRTRSSMNIIIPWILGLIFNRMIAGISMRIQFSSDSVYFFSLFFSPFNVILNYAPSNERFKISLGDFAFVSFVQNFATILVIV